MFNTCAASDSCILYTRESTHFRSHEHAIEISPGKTSRKPNVRRPAVLIDISNDKFLATRCDIDTRPRSIKLWRSLS